MRRHRLSLPSSIHRRSRFRNNRVLLADNSLQTITDISERLRSESSVPQFSGRLSSLWLTLLDRLVPVVLSLLPFLMQCVGIDCLPRVRKPEEHLYETLLLIAAAKEIHAYGVLTPGDISVSQPAEYKLENPLLSDPNNKVCVHCGAKLWKEETLGCCGNGRFAVPNLPPLPAEAEILFSQPSFLKNQRKMNSLFAFTALGASSSGCWQGPPPSSMLTMCGKACRRIFDAENPYTQETRLPSNHARFYVYDNEQKAHGESLGLDIDIINSIRDYFMVQKAVDEKMRKDDDIQTLRFASGPLIVPPTTPF